MAANSSEFETSDGVFLVGISSAGIRGPIKVVQNTTRIFFPGNTGQDSLGLTLVPERRAVDIEPCDDTEIFRMGTFLKRFLEMFSSWRFPSILTEGTLVPKICERDRHFILAEMGETYEVRSLRGQDPRRVQVSFVDPSQIPDLPSLDSLR